MLGIKRIPWLRAVQHEALMVHYLLTIHYPLHNPEDKNSGRRGLLIATIMPLLNCHPPDSRKIKTPEFISGVFLFGDKTTHWRSGSRTTSSLILPLFLFICPFLEGHCPFLEASAEIKKWFHFVFGSNDNNKICFLDLLAFSMYEDMYKRES